MKKITTFKLFSAFLVSALLLGSCTTEVDWDNLLDDVTIDHSLVIPIGEASTTLKEVLEQLDSTDLIGTADNSIFVKYTDSVDWTFRKIELLKDGVPINSQYFPSEGLTVPVPPSTSFKHIINENIDLGINSDPISESIDTIIGKYAKIKILLKKENIDIKASNVSYTISFPTSFIAFDDKSSSHTFQATKFDVEEEFLLPSFKMFTYNGAKNIPITIELNVVTGTAPIVITPLSSISATIEFSEINYKMIYGQFKPKISLDSEEEIVDMRDFESSLPKGLFRIANPTINLTVKNYTGIKINANLEFVKTYRHSEPTYEPIFATFENGNHNKSFELNASTEYDNPGITHITLDKVMGGIDKIFEREILPNMLQYKYNLTNIPSGITDFITDNAKVSIKFDLKVPLHLNGGSYIELNDTIKDLKINDVLDKDYIDKAVLVLNVTNGIPVGVDFKIKLLQADKSPVPNASIDSVSVIDAPDVDAKGLVLKNNLKVQTIEINIKKNQLEQLRKTKHLAFSVHIDRKDNKEINFELTNSFAINAGLFVKADILVGELNSNN